MSGMAILCSGQGYQGAGMFDLLGRYAGSGAQCSSSQNLFWTARIRGNWCARQATKNCTRTRSDGFLCCTQAMAAWAVVTGKVPRPLVVAGYSVGELAAWGVAGLLDYEGVLDLAVQRAAAMDAATTRQSGLVAIRGLGRAALDAICRTHDAYVAIVNGADEMLVGGTSGALAAVIQDAQVHGAERTTIVAVGVPSHTPLLADASDQFRHALTKAHLPGEIPSGVRLLSGIDGATVFDVHAGADKLARQIRADGGMGCLHTVLPRSRCCQGC